MIVEAYTTTSELCKNPTTCSILLGNLIYPCNVRTGFLQRHAATMVEQNRLKLFPLVIYGASKCSKFVFTCFEMPSKICLYYVFDCSPFTHMNILE